VGLAHLIGLRRLFLKPFNNQNMRQSWFLWLVLFSGILKANEIKIRLFATQTITQPIVNAKVGNYALVASNEKFQLLDTVFMPMQDVGHHVLYFSKSGQKIKVFTKDEVLGTFLGLILFPGNQEAEFLVSSNGKDRLYEGKLIIRLFEGQLQLINWLNMEDYVAGVVEAEGGHVDEYEYFKAQAVLARTYALRNLNKHIREGYNLKDDVSSQAFHGKCYLQNREPIRRAVAETRGLILIDEMNQPIDGLFHSNSGGHTANSQDVWSKSIPYLQGKPDPYSIAQPAAVWTKRVPASEVESYFAGKLKLQDRNGLREALQNFKQEQRQVYFVFGNQKVHLKEVRAHFKLRSTFFDLTLEGNEYVFFGRGNGHGVGMSQEGAMEMARQGFKFDEILYFYFSKIRLSGNSN
jgi:stage II sporulation protein D